MVDNQWVMTKACFLTAMGVIERIVLNYYYSKDYLYLCMD